MIKGLFFSTVFARTVHTSGLWRAVDKASLSKLRKRTGISFINCKKALEKFDNDVEQAEAWLKEEAQKQGWAKATKLGGRSMRSGLLGVRVDGNIAAMVEANCETDFVARNKKFQGLVAQINSVVLQKGQEGDSQKVYWEGEEFNQLSIDGDKKVSDVVALEVGSLGENMAARRAVVLRADGDTKLGSYVHSIGADKEANQCLLGKYASIIRYRQSATTDMPKTKFSVEEIARQLCQHIVGMNPQTIGTSEDEPSENKDTEPCMIHQEFLLDPEQTVNDILQQNAIEIDDFVRFECGEILESEKSKEEVSDADKRAAN